MRDVHLDGSHLRDNDVVMRLFNNYYLFELDTFLDLRFRISFRSPGGLTQFSRCKVTPAILHGCYNRLTLC